MGSRGLRSTASDPVLRTAFCILLPPDLALTSASFGFSSTSSSCRQPGIQLFREKPHCPEVLTLGSLPATLDFVGLELFSVQGSAGS